MGVYLYAIRQKNVSAIDLTSEENGTKVIRKVHLLTYHGRLSLSWDGLSLDGKIRQIERLWRCKKEYYDKSARLDFRGALVCWTDSFKNGAPVYRYRFMSPCCYDDVNPGELVGYMYKQGRNWIISPKINETMV